LNATVAQFFSGGVANFAICYVHLCFKDDVMYYITGSFGA